MKQTILILFFLISVFTTEAQTYVKTADKPEYARYIEYCNRFVTTRCVQLGRAYVVLDSITPIDSLKSFTIDTTKKVVWFTPIIPKYHDNDSTKIVSEYSYQGNQIFLVNSWFIWTRQRKHTIADFYSWWMPLKVKQQ